jgi:hypothetical protein
MIEAMRGLYSPAWLTSFGIDQATQQNTSAISSAFSGGSLEKRFIKLRPRGIVVALTALSYMMTGRSRMSAVNTSAMSTLNSTNAISALATLRFVGDALDPDEISNTLRQKPTRAYRKGERYKSGPRSPELSGKTGLWYLSTDDITPSNNLRDHLDALIRLISPFGDHDRRLRQLREIMDKRDLEAHLTLFWRGAPGAEKPSISSVQADVFRHLNADIETDFDDC